MITKSINRIKELVELMCIISSDISKTSSMGKKQSLTLKYQALEKQVKYNLKHLNDMVFTPVYQVKIWSEEENRTTVLTMANATEDEIRQLLNLKFSLLGINATILEIKIIPPRVEV